METSQIALPPRVLLGIKGRSPLGDPLPLPALPATPFSQSDLLVNAEGQPNIGSELKAELATADSVDLICAFVIWTGVRHLRDSLAEVVSVAVGSVSSRRPTWVRPRSVRSMSCLLSVRRFAWRLTRGRQSCMQRPGCSSARAGLTTAFVGSSNLSHTALFDGLEWNIRLSSMDAVHVIDRVRMMFESHWASEHFDAYDPSVNGEALALALAGVRPALAG